MNKPRVHHCDQIPRSGDLFLVTGNSVYFISNTTRRALNMILPEITMVDWKACPYCGELLINEEDDTK